MRKILLGFVLFVLIVTVSYVKTVRSERSKDSIREAVLNETVSEQSLLTSTVDSLQAELENSRIIYFDSLTLLNEFIENKSDSLEYLLNLSEEQIDALKASYEKKIKTIEQRLLNTSRKSTKSIPTSVKKKKNSQSLETDKKIINYYKKRHDDLPSDLTEYERRVAIAEIRTETINKFKVSMTHLNKLRDKNNIEY